MMKYSNIGPVWLLSTQRTGSTYLSRALGSTQLFHPTFTEWLMQGTWERTGRKCEHPHQKVLWDKWWSIPTPDKAALITTLPRHIKFQHEQYRVFFTDGDKSQIEAALPGLKYMRLRRRNHIACAASIYIAQYGFYGHYTHTSEESVDSHARTKLTIDDAKLADCLRSAKKDYQAWDQYLDDTERLEIEYEEFEHDPTDVLERVLNYLAVPCASVYAKNSVARLATMRKPLKLRHEMTETLKNRLRQLDI